MELDFPMMEGIWGTVESYRREPQWLCGVHQLIKCRFEQGAPSATAATFPLVTSPIRFLLSYRAQAGALARDGRSGIPLV